MHENTITEQSFQHISKTMGLTHELPVKIASYYGKPRVTSKIKKT